MIGPIVLGAALLYLAICIAVVRLAILYARSHGKSAARWGCSVGLVMYLIPFWDWLPTVATHQFYCVNNAGFWIYKAPDQWKTENPGVTTTLVENNRSPEGVAPNWPLEHRSDMKIAHINQRFAMAYKDHLSTQDEGELFLHVWRWKYELLDKKTGEVLARQVDFSSGNGYIGGEPPIKFWLQSNHCPNSREHSRELADFLKQFRGAKQ